MIVATGLTKRFKSLFRAPVFALDGLSFTARDGAITGLVGKNGSGKSTAARLCAGLIRPDTGTILVDGFDVATQSDQVRERLSIQPEARGLRGEMTGRQTLRQFGMLRGLSGGGLERRIDELIDMLDMRDIVDRRTRGLSRGQGAKVSVARTLIVPTPNIILDEPTVGLDLAAADTVREVIRSLRAEGRCVMVSSHFMLDISDLCDEVVLMRDGRSIGTGPLADLAAHYGFSDEQAFLISVIRRELSDDA